MAAKRGYVLIGLLLFFTVLGLSSTVAVIEQDTRLKRFSEDDLRLNLGAIRRGIDLYRYKKMETGGDPDFEYALSTGDMNTVIEKLSHSTFIRSGVAEGTVPWRHNPRNWRIVSNYVINPSFEIDDGSMNIPEVDGWRGNFTADDGVPDGWNLTSDGAEQHIRIVDTGTYVVSFWARAVTATSRARLRVWRISPVAEGIPAIDLTADIRGWKRYFGSFDVTAVPQVIKLELIQAGGASGDAVYIDGLMLEKWNPPPGLNAAVQPSPAAWTADYTITPTATESALQQRLFREMIPEGANPEDYSWWFMW